MRVRIAVCFCVLHLLLSCATTDSANTPRPDWQQQQQQAQLVRDWQLVAVVQGTRKAHGQNKQARFTGDIAWHVVSDTSTLYFLGPFGGVRGEYVVDTTAPEQAYLQLDGRRPLYGDEIDDFLSAQLGVTQTDIRYLRAWVLGAPHKSEMAVVAYNQHNQLMEISERDTRVEYVAFVPKEKRLMPRIIKLDNPLMTMTIQIDWERLNGAE